VEYFAAFFSNELLYAQHYCKNFKSIFILLASNRKHCEETRSLNVNKYRFTFPVV
jgi:hypothetical protein